MIKVIKDKFNSMDGKIKKILFRGIHFSIVISLISTIILLTYHFNMNINLFYIGLSVFKLSLFLLVEFIICAIAIDTIAKQVNI